MRPIGVFTFGAIAPFGVIEAITKIGAVRDIGYSYWSHSRYWSDSTYRHCSAAPGRPVQEMHGRVREARPEGCARRPHQRHYPHQDTYPGGAVFERHKPRAAEGVSVSG